MYVAKTKIKRSDFQNYKKCNIFMQKKSSLIRKFDSTCLNQKSPLSQFLEAKNLGYTWQTFPDPIDPYIFCVASYEFSGSFLQKLKWLSNIGYILPSIFLPTMMHPIKISFWLNINYTWLSKSFIIECKKSMKNKMVCYLSLSPEGESIKIICKTKASSQTNILYFHIL